VQGTDPNADPFAAAVLANVWPRGEFRFDDVVPHKPMGGCAGVDWQMFASVRRQALS
jgi:hypothetical protein